MMSIKIYLFYKWLEEPFKKLSWHFRSKKSIYQDMNKEDCFVGDTLIHHRHDPSKRGDICKHDIEFKLKWDEWGRVVGENFGANHLYWLMEKKVTNQ